MKKRAVKIAVFHGIGVLVFFLLIIFLFEYPFSPPATEPVAVVKTAPSKPEPTAPPKKFETCEFSVSDGDESIYFDLCSGDEYYLLDVTHKDPFGKVKKYYTTMISTEDEKLISLVNSLQQLFLISVSEEPSSPYLEFPTRNGESSFCKVSDVVLLMLQEKVEEFLLPADSAERFGPVYAGGILEEFSLHNIYVVKNNSGNKEYYGLFEEQLDYTHCLPSGRGGTISETSAISWKEEEYQAAYSAICQLIRDGSLNLRFRDFSFADLYPNDVAVRFVIDSDYPGFSGFCYAYDSNGEVLTEVLELLDAAVKSQEERS